MDNMKEKARKKRGQIMDAALAVFREHGYEKTKIIDIAKEAGIGKGTVHEYFESKEQLFTELLDSYCEYYEENVERILEEQRGRSCREILLAAISFERRLQKDVGFQSMNPIHFQLEFIHFPGLKERMYRVLGFKFRVLRSILDQGVASGELRAVNTALAAILLMGLGGIAGDFVESHKAATCCPLSGNGVEPLLDPATLEQFTDENLVEQVFRGFCA